MNQERVSINPSIVQIPTQFLSNDDYSQFSKLNHLYATIPKILYKKYLAAAYSRYFFGD